MPQVVVQSETDVPQGWRYVISVTAEDGAETTHRVRLGWVDHNHWAGERAIPPSSVAEGIVRYLLDRADSPLPERFDAASARRWAPDIDRELDRYISDLPGPGFTD